MAGCYKGFVTVSWMHQITKTHFHVFFAYFYEEICILSVLIVDRFLQSVGFSTVSPTKLYAEDESKFQQKALRSREN